MHQRRQRTMATGIAFCVSLFFLLCPAGGRGERALDCCLKVSRTKIPARIVRGYERQYGGNGCVISAVVFVTRKGRGLCAPPGLPWVEDLIAKLDRERKRCQDSAFEKKKWCRTLRF